MKLLINPSHLVISLILQGLFYLIHGDLWLGAVAGLFFYLGRELAQAEFRGIEASPTKPRKNFPFRVVLFPKLAQLELRIHGHRHRQQLTT